MIGLSRVRSAGICTLRRTGVGVAPLRVVNPSWFDTHSANSLKAVAETRPDPAENSFCATMELFVSNCTFQMLANSVRGFFSSCAPAAEALVEDAFERTIA